MVNILVYTGAETLDNAYPQLANLPVLCRSVLQLALPYLWKGHHILLTNFTSLPFIQILAEQHTTQAPFVKNRVDLPDPIRAQFFFRDDETVQFCWGRLMVIAWRAKAKKKPVIMVSSAYSAGMTDVQNRRGDTVKKPVSVDKYNKSMNGVDHHDQYCVYYSFVRKTIKWWRKLFFYLLECSTVNSYILYKETCSAARKKPLTSLEYRRSVVEALAQEHLQDSSSHPSAGHQHVGPTPIV